MNPPIQTSVVVVGGSLIGLSTALFLAHRNVPVILVERYLTSSLHPRAIGYTTRTIELLESVDTASRLPTMPWAGAPPRRVVVESLAGKWQDEQQWSSKPEGQKPGPDKKGPGGPVGLNVYSPVQAIATAQDKFEPVLRERAIELGANLRLGYTVTSVQQDENGVTVKAIDKSGEESTFFSKYLVACDGGRSPIREQLGIKRQGAGHVRSMRSILFRCTQVDKYLESGYVQFQIEGRDDGFEAFVTTYGDGRWVVMWADSEDAPMDEKAQKDKIRKAVGSDIPDEEVTLITSGQWDLGGHIADAFSSGRIFLAGDAAHALPPNRGGYGANTGIADAHNLAWKLAAVLSGASQPALLDTYNAERRPVARVRHDQIFLRDDYKRHVEGREWPGKSDEMLDDLAVELGQLYRSGGIIGADGELPLARRPDEWHGQPGTRAPHVALKKNGKAISSLDLFGQGWVLVGADEQWRGLVSNAAEATGIECEFVQVGEDVEEEKKGSFEEAYGLGISGAVLVRPDGHIAWRTVDEPEDARSALSQALATASYAVKTAN